MIIFLYRTNMYIDLHTHTNVSDGELSPLELIDRAIKRDINIISVTDHDTVSAYQQLDMSITAPRIIPGIEFSTYWNKSGIHIVGLNIDPECDAMNEAVEFQHNARILRAEVIAERLEKRGIRDALNGAREIADNNNIGRPHFARHIVNIGAAKSMGDAFKKYLAAGKTGDIKKYWAPLPVIIDWIRGAGGIAVIAHPIKYKLSNSKLIALVEDFVKAGGQGIEVISGKQLPAETGLLAGICKRNNLLASCGSDFHQPDQPWAELGEFQPLPGECIPVWECF